MPLTYLLAYESTFGLDFTLLQLSSGSVRVQCPLRTSGEIGGEKEQQRERDKDEEKKKKTRKREGKK